MTEKPSKAKIMAINDAKQTLSVLTVTGPYKDRLYRLSLRQGVVVDQFVDVIIGQSGHTARWPDAS